MKNRLPLFLMITVCSVCAGCAARPYGDGAPPTPVATTQTPATDPKPVPEPRSRYGNPVSYEELGRRYHVLDSADGYTERGIASWYGTKFHGRRTSSGDTYDMHAMTAAHKTLPLPTWAEVTNLRNGRKIVVRINDRGPFVENRIIDLSYEAAQRLDIVADGTGLVEVRAITFDGNEPRRAVTSDDITAQTQPPPARLPDTTSMPADVAPTRSPTTTPTVNASAAPAVAAGAASTNTSADTVAATDVQTSDTQTSPQMYAQVGAFGERSNATGLTLRLQQTGFEQVVIYENRQEHPPFYRVRIGPFSKVEHYDHLVQRLLASGINTISMIIE